MAQTSTTDASGDREAVLATLRGQADAFDALVERYGAMVYACTYGITGNRADAADAAQDAFLCLYRNLEQFDPERPLKPYLMTIAVNCARSQMRRQRRQRGEDSEPGALQDVPDPRPVPAQAHLRNERREVLRHAMADLPAMLREVCVLFYLQGCTCREAAGILKTTEGAVKTALHRARVRLLAGPLKEWLAP